MRVWKWALAPGYNEIAVPLGAKPLSVVAQHGVSLFMAVSGDEPDEQKDTQAFYVALTGEEIPLDASTSEFLGTVREPGAFVAHVFQVAPQEEPLPPSLVAIGDEA